jgi:hypothetical protein
MYVSADCDGAFLRKCQWTCKDAWGCCTYHWLNVRFLLQDFASLSHMYVSKWNTRYNAARAIVAYLLAKPLDVAFSQLLATHKALDPAVQGRNCCGLRGWDGRHLHGLRHLDVLHVGIHGCGVVTGGGVVACCDGERSRGSCPLTWQMTCQCSASGKTSGRWCTV